MSGDRDRRRSRAFLASQLLIFGMIFVLVSLVWYGVLIEPVDQVLGVANNTTTTQYGHTGIKWVGQLADWFALFAGLLGFVMIVASAFFESGSGGI